MGNKFCLLEQVQSSDFGAATASTAGACLVLRKGPVHRTWEERGYFCTVGQAAIL